MIHLHDSHQLPDPLPSPDVYFRKGYGRAASIADRGEWVLLEAFDGNWQVPLIVRTLTDGAKDAMSPYGYSGIYASPALSAIQTQDAWSATVKVLRELGVISVLLRHSPLVPQASDLPGLHSIISGHPTIVLESVDRDTAWSGMVGTCRTATRKAIKNGYTSDVRQATEQDLAPDGGFRRLYSQTMQRLNAAPAYFFNDDYYRELLDGLGSNLIISEVRDQEGVVASSGLLMRHDQRLHGHLGGSSPADARLGANNLLTWAEMQFAIDQGVRQYHLGGGLGPRDNLFKFKRSFGGRELEYRVSGVIIDPALYLTHTKDRAKACETTQEALLTSNFFPAYRGRPAHV
jgi:Acetyltransferase (GNAT) domain